MSFPQYVNNMWIVNHSLLEKISTELWILSIDVIFPRC